MECGCSGTDSVSQIPPGENEVENDHETIAVSLDGGKKGRMCG
jgi:hypothetical protein